MAVEGLSNPNAPHMGRLKFGSQGIRSLLAAKIAIYLAGLFVSLLVFASAVLLFNSENDQSSTIYNELASIQEPWSDSLVEQLTNYRGWLSRHGTKTERSLFDGFATILLKSVTLHSVNPNESLLESLLFSALTGVLRVAFLFVASARLWLATLLVAMYLGAFRHRAYFGDDLLGQTGNGRLFYSGINAGLDPMSTTGAPDVLIRGLACPNHARRSETHASPIWTSLVEWQAGNATNESLAAILVCHRDTAAFVPKLDEESRFKESFEGASIGEYLPHLLRGALQLHAAYASGNLHPALPTSNKAGAPGARGYAQLVTNALHQVLSLNQRQLIGELGATEIATLILALEAGKVLAHSMEGGKWFRVSNSIHLSARAVLHSVLAYPKDYAFTSRERIRKALVYASRYSPFAPVRMPAELELDTCALRQWAEVLLVLPHHLRDSVEEIELAGLIREAHRRWSDEILPKGNVLISDLSSTSCATQSGLVLLSVSALVRLLRLAVTDRELTRLYELSSRVGDRQRRAGATEHSTGDESPPTLLSDRVFVPFSNSEITTLSKLHDIPESDLQEWSVLRNIIASFGWLARRVGDYTVPESSIILTVFPVPPRFEGGNSYGFLGKRGLVPLRESKCRECCGAQWIKPFALFPKATMAETQEQFERQLKGIQDQITEDPMPAPAPV